MGVDPDLYQLWHSSQAGANQLNFVGYDSPTADTLIEGIREEYDLAAQRKLAHELHRVIADDQPYTFLYAPLTTRVLDQKIVMLDEAGEYTAIRPSKSGDIFYHFNRWKKLDVTPDF
jgi:ABC-type transport system substrate-binding protein